MAETFRQYYLKAGSMYSKASFEVDNFCKSRYNCNTKNLLARICNTFVNAVTKHGRLPKYAVFVLDTDILEYLGYSKFGASTLLGKWLEWVVQQVGAIVVEHNQQLPKKAVNNVFIYWVLAPGHVNFPAEQKIARAKMNNCLESVIKLHQNMRVMRLMQHWDQNDMNLVNPRTGEIHGRWSFGNMEFH